MVGEAERYQLMLGWLSTVLSPPWRIEPASLDASFRRYFRVHVGGERWILMDAPPPQEDVNRFVGVQALFHSLGIRVPEIIAAEPRSGFLLLTDFGNQLYLHTLEHADHPTVDKLYADALDTLWNLQSGQSDHGLSLPIYDEALLRRELAIFEDWFLATHLGIHLAPQEQALLARFSTLLVDNALAQPRVRVHRDYHSRNLMVMADQGPGVLDFQDAVIGPVTYDLVSLLRDCYIAWPGERVRSWCLAYRQRLLGTGLEGPDQQTFLRWFDLMGVQRHLKAVGIFARLNHRDHRPGYLADIPRTLDHVRAVVTRLPECHDFAAWLTRRVPVCAP